MIITIGSFDGFHRGHAELFELCRRNAVNNDWAVFTFWPHPSEFMHRINHALFTLEEREIIRRVLDVPAMYVLKFNDALKNLPPADFWHLLRKNFRIDGLVMGSDFHFGRAREGTCASLCELAESEGVASSRIIVAELLNKGEFSSSLVRQKVLEGDISAASEILGYKYFMLSDVIHGNERGRTMNFPTANLNLKGRIIPAYGVYAVALLVNDAWHCGALSIGNNPTFHDVKETRAEVHILDFSGDIYGDKLPVFFLERVRDVKTFSGKSELMSQIERDITTCRKIYADIDDSTQKFFERVRKIYTMGESFTPEIIRLL